MSQEYLIGFHKNGYTVDTDMEIYVFVTKDGLMEFLNEQILSPEEP